MHTVILGLLRPDTIALWWTWFQDDRFGFCGKPAGFRAARVNDDSLKDFSYVGIEGQKFMVRDPQVVWSDLVLVLGVDELTWKISDLRIGMQSLVVAR